jgi:chromosome segregation ATPase
MGNLDRLYRQLSERNPAGAGEPELADEEAVRLGSATVAVPTKAHSALELVYQVVEVIDVIEDRANETEKTLRQKLEFAEKRVDALEADLHSGEARLAQMQAKLRESDEISRTDRSRLEVAEKRICELEMRARTAEAQAKNNSHTLARIEEAIRTQILEKRLPPNKLTLSS